MKLIKFSGNLMEKTLNSILKKSELSGVSWSRFHEMNNLLKGFRPGELTVLSGRTGVGKTTFLCEYSLDLCEKGVPTLWGSFEMPIQKICATMMQQFAGEPLGNAPVERLEIWAAAFSALPIYFVDAYGSQDPNDVLKLLNQSVKSHGVSHFVLDNLQFLLGSNDSNFGERFHRQDKLVQELRSFSTTSHCHTTVVAHPRKDDESKMLSVNSLYGGVKLSQESDNVLLLQTEPNTAFPKKFIQVIKNRYDGTLGNMDLRFNKDRASFRPPVREFNDAKIMSKVLCDGKAI